MKTYCSFRGAAPLILNLGCKWKWVVYFTAQPLSTGGERSHGTDWMGGWMGLDVLESVYPLTETNFMEKALNWEAKSGLPNGEMSHVQCKETIHYHAYTIKQLVPMLSQMNSVLRFIPNFLKPILVLSSNLGLRITGSDYLPSNVLNTRPVSCNISPISCSVIWLS
jgi:hypothetical protein